MLMVVEMQNAGFLGLILAERSWQIRPAVRSPLRPLHTTLVRRLDPTVHSVPSHSGEGPLRSAPWQSRSLLLSLLLRPPINNLRTRVLGPPFSVSSTYPYL